jgi:hypothetical protein
MSGDNPTGRGILRPLRARLFLGVRLLRTCHLVGNVGTLTGPGTADVRSLINSTHWMADGRLLFAPIDDTTSSPAVVD